MKGRVRHNAVLSNSIPFLNQLFTPSQPKARNPDPRPEVISGSNRIRARADENTIRLIDAQTGKLLSQGVTRGAVVAIAFSPDERVLATGGPDRRVALWDVPTGKMIRELQARPVAAIRFSPDGKLLIVRSNDQIERTFDIATGKEMRVTGN